MKNILVLGAGVAGSSLAYYLKLKDYKITIVDQNKIPGGLARTCYYSNHPYEFGPHIWFWPGGPEDPVNKTIIDLTSNELYYIDRKLYSFIEKDNSKYRYPVHFSDIENMPEKELIRKQLSVNRDENLKLITDKLPQLGNCTFEEYFTSAIGSILYDKFMSNYTHKMWNIPGNQLQTSMVWADRFRHAYSKNGDGKRGLDGYDPLKFENHTLGKGIKFQVYPKKGWNDVWDKMVEGCEYINTQILNIENEYKNPFVNTEAGEKFYFSKYDYVINTIDIDHLWGEDKLPYTGRMMIPLLLPEIGNGFTGNIESYHFSGAEFQTRVTEMKSITKYESPDTLILIEVPVLPGAENFFPQNTIKYASENNLFASKAYPQQSPEGFRLYNSYTERGKKITNLLHCGRHAEFKYWGMPETVFSAYKLALNL